MIGALWSNSNYDDDKGSRGKAIAEVEERFENAVKAIYGQEHHDIDWEDPFFSASKAPRLGFDFGVPDKEQLEKEERRQEALKELDQT